MISEETYQELCKWANGLGNNGMDALHDVIVQYKNIHVDVLKHKVRNVILNNYKSVNPADYSNREQTFCCIGCKEVFPSMQGKIVRVKNIIHLWKRCPECRNKLYAKNRKKAYSQLTEDQKDIKNAKMRQWRIDIKVKNPTLYEEARKRKAEYNKQYYLKRKSA